MGLKHISAFQQQVSTKVGLDKSTHKVFYQEIDLGSFTYRQCFKLQAKAYVWNCEN